MFNLVNNQFTASLWGDEAFAAVLAQKSLLDIVRIVSHDTSPPLYYFSSHFWMKIFGPSEGAIRALSFLFFLGTIITIFFLAKHLWGKKTAFLAAALTATNPFLFSYAFEGRMYAILAFTTTASFYFFFTQNWPFYVLAATSALYSHHFSIFALFVQFLWVIRDFFTRSKKSKKKWQPFLAFLFIFILYIPWLWPLYYQTRLVQSGFWLAKPTLASINDLLGSFLAFGIEGAWSRIIPFLVIILILLRRWDLKAKSKDYFHVLWFSLPILLTFIISQAKSSIFYDRYLLYTLPALTLILASQRRKISLLLIVFLICLWGFFDLQYFFHPIKKPFRQLSDYIKLNTTADDLLINYNGQAHHLWESKYYDLTAPLYSSGGRLPFYVGTALMTNDDVIYSLPKLERIGVISSDEPQSIKIENYQTTFVKKTDGLYFLWMERIP